MRRESVGLLWLFRWQCKDKTHARAHDGIEREMNSGRFKGRPSWVFGFFDKTREPIDIYVTRIP
jgi:hypothetical protein